MLIFAPLHGGTVNQPRRHHMSDLFVESLGTGTPVVLVHGSLATGAEDFRRDATDIVTLMGDGAPDGP